eukprot:m.115232 g.115232  ORF g.115232 m.115232 type:complete len:59 (-) comp15484_c0_seq2:1913-2089(-)
MINCLAGQTALKTAFSAHEVSVIYPKPEAKPKTLIQAESQPFLTKRRGKPHHNSSFGA